MKTGIRSDPGFRTLTPSLEAEAERIAGELGDEFLIQEADARLGPEVSMPYDEIAWLMKHAGYGPPPDAVLTDLAWKRESGWQTGADERSYRLTLLFFGTEEEVLARLVRAREGGRNRVQREREASRSDGTLRAAFLRRKDEVLTGPAAVGRLRQYAGPTTRTCDWTPEYRELMDAYAKLARLVLLFERPENRDDPVLYEWCVHGLGVIRRLSEVCAARTRG